MNGNKIVNINGVEFRIYAAQDTKMPTPFLQFWIDGKLVTRAEFKKTLRAVIEPVRTALDCTYLY